MSRVSPSITRITLTSVQSKHLRVSVGIADASTGKQSEEDEKTHLHPVFPIVGVSAATVYMWLDLSVQVGAMLVARNPVPVTANTIGKIDTSGHVK